MDYNSWVATLREVLQEKEKPLTLRNGHWEVVDRKALWHALSSRIFDAHLNQFKVCAIEVLTEMDPQFVPCVLPEIPFFSAILEIY